MSRLTKILLGFLWTATVSGLSVQELPVCAQNCLANSTAAQNTCQVIDIACLCTNQAYVATLSCCLSQQCDAADQATSIQFNQQECSGVGQSAPNFVGCSPLNGSVASVDGNVPTKSASTLSTSFTSNTLISTLTGKTVTEPASPIGATSTASFNGKPLLTGSCTVPYLALVTDANKHTTEFPAIGCAPDRPNCCPYQYGQDAVISQCPQDYFTTAGGCCPVGYQGYYTNIGAYTPCYSMPSTTVVPASSPTAPGLTLITDHVFAQKLMLAKPKAGELSPEVRNGIIGGTVNAILFAIIIILLIRFLRKRKARRELEASRATTFPPVEPNIPIEGLPPQTPHELPSPDPTSRSPTSGIGREMSWPAEAKTPLSPTKSLIRVPTAPKELPGSTFIHEHHPAFSSRDPSEVASATPSSPPMTPTRSRPESAGSSAVTPLSSPPIGAGQRSPIISPLNSPRIPPARLG